MMSPASLAAFSAALSSSANATEAASPLGDDALDSAGVVGAFAASRPGPLDKGCSKGS